MRVSLAVGLLALLGVAGCGSATSTPNSGVSPSLTATGIAATSSSVTGTPKPSVRPGTGAVVALAVGGLHACALLDLGTVKCWGANYAGQLGDGTSTPGSFVQAVLISTPVSVVAAAGSATALSGVTAITAGYAHTCALITGGTVKCWDANAATPSGGLLGPAPRSGGELGDGTTTDSKTPVTVVAGPGSTSALSGVVAISAGSEYTCALLADHTVKCWGQAPDGGNLTPTTVVAGNGSTSALSGVVAISAGDFHACALISDGTVKCWGRDINDQLGDGSTSKPSLPPVTVIAGSGGDGNLSGVTAITAGHGMALGQNAIAVGDTCALVADHSVRCWGSNDRGQIGDAGASPDGTWPVPVLSGTGGPGSILSNVLQIAAGGVHTCALMLGGNVDCWGMDYSAGNDGVGYSVPFLAAGAGSKPLSGVIAIAAGGAETCAILDDGSVTCWSQFSQTPALVPGFLVAKPAPTSGPTVTTSQPDGRVRLSGTGYSGKSKSYQGPFAGDNVYNTTGVGQTDFEESFSELEGQFFSFDISVQNDGTQPDTFKVKAAGSGTGWTVAYFQGTIDITSAVQAGTYQTSSLAPGATYLITARVTFGQPLDTTRLMTVTSLADATKMDTVQFGVKEGPCSC
jgi:alpha-tubulin suppressor-like RCC1 family protein